ncbi:hypothetical protein D3C75_861890 [compost metagenome]
MFLESAGERLQAVAASHIHMEAGRLHPLLQTKSALGGFVTCTDFVIVKHIFGAYGRRGEIRHQDIRSSLQRPLAPARMGGAHRGSRRNQGIRHHQPGQGNHVERVLYRSRKLVP